MNMDGKLQGAQALSRMQASRVADLAAKARGVKAEGKSADARKGEEAAKAFEGYFNMVLVKQLRKSLPEGFFSGTGSDVYGSWFDQYVGQTLAERNGLGIGDMIRDSLARSTNPSATPDFTKGERSIAAEERKR